MNQDFASPQEEPSGQPEVSTNSIEITRGQKGTYGWTIKVRWPVGIAAQQTLADIKGIDSDLRATFGAEG